MAVWMYGYMSGLDKRVRAKGDPVFGYQSVTERSLFGKSPNLEILVLFLGVGIPKSTCAVNPSL